MSLNNEKICSLFFREAELGNWERFTIKNIADQLKVKENELKKIIPNKEKFLKFYNNTVDLQVLNDISEEELKISSNDEIIQEYFMNKLEIMSKYKFGFINIINTSITNPNFLFININSNKESINKFLEKVSNNKKNISKVILSKLLLGVWLLAFNNWLYDDESDKGSVIINKGIRRIKISTSLFSKI